MKRLYWVLMLALLHWSGMGTAQTIMADGFESTVVLGSAPTVLIQRDDRVATLSLDHDPADTGYPFWDMSGAPTDDAGFLVIWWPLTTGLGASKVRAITGNDSGGNCLNPDHLTAPIFNEAKLALPAGARWLVTGNRRVQIQPLINQSPYRLRVQRLNALGQISSVATELDFNGGDPARVDALRASLTYFDDFNLPMGAADERLWNNAVSTSTDPRYNQFFINDQYHAHTMHGTSTENVGDKSQTAQRFRKKIRIENGVRRRVVFDMDSPLSSRSVWYLDFNPIPTDVTAHASFFDEEGDSGLPAGMLRLRMGFQTLSVSMIDQLGASHRIASVDMQEQGRRAFSNVRRAFDVRVGTDGIQIFIDGKSVLNTPYIGSASGQTYTFPAGDYELLWVGFGYNTTKDDVPYYLIHWDNFGFDGPVVDSRVVHNYVTRIAGNDFQKANRSNAQVPSYTIAIPDDLRPNQAGAVAEAWLVFTYQMGDYSWMSIEPGDHVQINGGPSVPLPQPLNNSGNPDLNPSTTWGLPYTSRVKIADLTPASSAPFVVGNNQFVFRAGNVGLLNVHLEVLYPSGAAPAYTPPSAIHPFPLHAEVPRFGAPARIHHVGATEVRPEHVLEPEHLDPGQADWVVASGNVVLDMEVGNSSWNSGWAPQWMNVPVQSAEVWSTGGTAGIAKLEVFLRPAGVGTPPGTRIILLETAIDAPAPQGRYRLPFNTLEYPNGDYELFLQGSSPSGLKTHPSYGHEIYEFGSENLSGAYRPVRVRIQN